MPQAHRRVFATILGLGWATAVPVPYLRLQDNLDEPTELGYCLDLRGWDPPSFISLQAHSCKPSYSTAAGGGSDQSFAVGGSSIKGQLDAAGMCLQAAELTINSQINAAACSAAEPLQQLCHNADGTISVGGLCLVASPFGFVGEGEDEPDPFCFGACDSERQEQGRI